MLSFLVRHNAEAHAFKLAEDFGDFKALTELCYENSVVSDDATTSRVGKKDISHQHQSQLQHHKQVDAKIEHYIQLYKEAFAFELYQWWIEQGT